MNLRTRKHAGFWTARFAENPTVVHVRDIDGVITVDMGRMDIWDGGDLVLLRETMNFLIEREGCHSIAIDMQHVKSIPSGFFGMLYDLSDAGTSVQLLLPHANVMNMLWFQIFFEHLRDGRHSFREDTRPVVIGADRTIQVLPLPVANFEASAAVVNTMHHRELEQAVMPQTTGGTESESIAGSHISEEKQADDSDDESEREGNDHPHGEYGATNDVDSKSVVSSTDLVSACDGSVGC